MPSLAELKQLPPDLRRRNRRLGWLITVIAVACLLWSHWAVVHGWIYPESATYAFPHWMH